jgi:hypothetical protein
MNDPGADVPMSSDFVAIDLCAATLLVPTLIGAKSQYRRRVPRGVRS